MENRVKRSMAVALAALLLAGCTKSESTSQTATTPAAAGGQAPARKGAPHELILGDVQDVANLNPAMVAAVSLGELSQLTEAYLVRYGKDNRPIPELATVVPTQANGGVSKDGKTITWHLRRGVKWSDGQPFDGDDLIFSVNAVNNPANNVTGRDGFDLITKMDEPDKYTVVFHLKKPYGAYLPTFFGSAGANPAIMPKHLLGSLPNINNAPWNAKPVGIGPFRYTEWVRGDHITMEANPYYWRGMPKLKRIVWKLIPDRNTLLTQLQTGEVDMWLFVPATYSPRVIALPGVTAYRGPSYLYSHVDFNTQHPALHDPIVREALRMATDRKTILDKLAHGFGILQESQMTPAAPFYSPMPLAPFNIAQANKMLDGDGWVRGSDGIRAKNGVKLALTLASGSSVPDIDQRIELIRSTWKQVGVSLTVQHYNQALFFGPYANGGILLNGKWDVVTFAWQLTPDGDVSNTNDCTQIPPNGQNVTRLCDPQIQAAVDKLKVTYDEAGRKAADTAAIKRITQVVPYFVLYIQQDVHAYNSALTGFHPNSVTPFDDMMNVDI